MTTLSAQISAGALRRFAEAVNDDEKTVEITIEQDDELTTMEIVVTANPFGRSPDAMTLDALKRFGKE